MKTVWIVYDSGLEYGDEVEIFETEEKADKAIKEYKKHESDLEADFQAQYIKKEMEVK